MIIEPEYLYPAPFYNFLSFIAEHDINGPILDCGAGGPRPKQALFVRLGFQAFGIEISKERMQMAQNYANEEGLRLTMQIGDMRKIGYPSNHFEGIYSWNTIFHMNKLDIKKGLQEMVRVLKPGGLCFVNFLTTESDRYSEGEEQTPGERVQIIDDETVLHTFLRDDEADAFFHNLKIKVLFREKRTFSRRYDDEMEKDSYIDYIIQKSL